MNILRKRKIRLLKQSAPVKDDNGKERHKCTYCSNVFFPKELTIDHKNPLNLGGSNDIDNLCLSCRTCNGLKKDHRYSDYILAINTIGHEKYRSLIYDINKNVLRSGLRKLQTRINYIINQ